MRVRVSKGFNLPLFDFTYVNISLLSFDGPLTNRIDEKIIKELKVSLFIVLLLIIIFRRRVFYCLLLLELILDDYIRKQRMNGNAVKLRFK